MPRVKKAAKKLSAGRAAGQDRQTLRIKGELITLIKKYCQLNEVSQRKLASMVPGLTQDRVSKIFSGQISHMTIDKLVSILSAIRMKVRLNVA